MGDQSTPAPFEPPPWEKSQFEELARKRAAAQEGSEINEPIVRPIKNKELPPQTEMLLAQLKAEEPDTSKGLWRAGLVFVVLVGIIGIVLVVWGVTGLITGRENGATVVVGGSIMIFFGLLFAGTAAWLAVRTMRQQGVL